MKKSYDGMQRVLFGNIVLSRGSTMYARRLCERIKKQITALAPTSMTVRVITYPERDYEVWIGGSRLTNLPTFREMVITRNEYQEFGPCIVLLKCV